MKVQKKKLFGKYGVKVTGLKYPFNYQDVHDLAHLLKQELVVALKKVNFNVEQFYELSGLLGTVATHGQKKNVPTRHLTGYYDEAGCPIYPGLDKVTAKKKWSNKKGTSYEGVAAGFSKRLNWHNAESLRDKIPFYLPGNKSIKGYIERPLPEFVGLQGVEGTTGSVTQVCQTIDRFEKESAEHKFWMRNTQVRWGFVDGEEGIIPDVDESYRNIEFGHGGDHLMNKVKPLVAICTNGKEGVHFSPSQVTEIIGASTSEFIDFKNYFMDNYVQEDYIYDHIWDDGDILYMDQVNCIHRRTDVKGDVAGLTMKKLERRLLHRIEFHVVTDQDELRVKKILG